jgi:DNA-directed RNA polymerase subunit N (RpoN/RPB10)
MSTNDTFVVGIPRCITCGGVTGGAIQKIYNEKRLVKIKNIMEEQGVTDYSLILDIDVDTDDILDELEVKRGCCRQQLITWKKLE